MISIIIPVYNRAHQIGECLNSISNQTLKDYELIIVNDGSTDNIREVVRPYKQVFGNKIKFFNQENKGPNPARNAGAKFAKGEFIIFCDADVIMEKDMLELMMNELDKNPDIGYVYSSFILNRKKFKLWPFDEEKLKQMPYIHTTSLIRKKYFPGFDENIKKFQDWDLWLIMLRKGRKGKWIDKFLFRKQSSATMSSWLPSFAYKLLPFLPQVKKYKEAMEIIKIKHNLK